ncbi:MAG TPA: polysaccharide biosynthesis/export family protein [Xanthobacteraceae bacterium]|jgi:polysaccharide export outer membrane protein
MRLVRLLLALLLAAAATGCASVGVPGLVGGPAPEPGAPADLDSVLYNRSATFAAPDPAVVAPAAVLPAIPAAVLPGPAPGGDEPYRLDAGDRLRVVVFGQDGLSNTYLIDVGGKIALPLIGAVSARGCTTAQLARLIADRLRGGGFIREPHVAIEVEVYRPFFILGEVIAPGAYPYLPNMTVETAVAIAGGFTPRAYRWDAEISRSSSGVTARQKVPLIAPVRPGDTVKIGERWF